MGCWSHSLESRDVMKEMRYWGGGGRTAPKARKGWLEFLYCCRSQTSAPAASRGQHWRRIVSGREAK
jgi:hypothetical protein